MKMSKNECLKILPKMTNYMVTEDLICKLISFLSWQLFYLTMVAKSGRHRSPEWCNRIVTLLHGSITTIWSWAICSFNFRCGPHFDEPTTSSQYLVMLFSWGYFLFDLVWCALYWDDTPVIYVHHIFSFAFLTRFLHKGTGGQSICCIMAALEMTNPLLQIRWLLREAGYEKSAIFTFIEWLYLFLFLSVRGGFGTYMCYKLFPCTHIDVEAKSMFFLMYLVSLIFIYDIISFVNYKYGKTFVTSFCRGIHGFFQGVAERIYRLTQLLQNGS